MISKRFGKLELRYRKVSNNLYDGVLLKIEPNGYLTEVSLKENIFLEMFDWKYFFEEAFFSMPYDQIQKFELTLTKLEKLKAFI